MDIKWELHCSGEGVQIGRGWKFRRELLPDAMALLMRCISGSWKGGRNARTWEVYVWAIDRQRGTQIDVGRMQWTNEQRKWFERHMKKLVEGTKATGGC